MVSKSELLWNMIASISASALSPLLLLITTRINGVEQAGVFAIVFTTSVILNAISDYGLRVYQVTDTSRRYQFNVYFSTRWLVSGVMMLIGFLYVIVSGYSFQKAALCIILVGYRFIDALSETFQGEFQLRNKLDIAGKSVFIRVVLSLIIFTVTDYTWHNMLLSTVAMVVMNIAGILLYDVRIIKQKVKLELSNHYKEICSVLRNCFPLMVSIFLNQYIINAPKYAIDNLMSYEIQTYFNILYLPTFTINLMSIFVLKPMLLSLGLAWNNGEKEKFFKIVRKLVKYVLFLTILVEAICFIIGIPILSFLYGVNLSRYKYDLLILVLSGGFSALTVVLFYALTTMRCQRKIILGYLASAVTGFFASDILVASLAMTGAAVSSVLIMAVLFVVLCIIMLYECSQDNGKMCMIKLQNIKSRGRI